MERKELNLKDLEAIAAGYSVPFIAGPVVLLVSAVDLAKIGMTAAQVQAQTGCEVQVR